MMDLSPVAQAILVYSVLGFGVLVLLLALARGGLLASKPAADRRSRAARQGFLAASVGMGSISGSILALELGGPGAIGWMWITALLGMGLIYADVLLAIRHRRRLPEGELRTGAVYVIERVFGAGGRVPALVFGRTLAIVFTLVLLGFALSAGSLLQTQQSSELLVALGGDRMLVVGVLVGAAALGMAIPRLRAFVVTLGPVAVGLYAIATVWMILRAPGDAGAALGSIVEAMFGGGSVAGGAAGGGLLLAMQAGVLRATLATEAGLGSAGFTEEIERVRSPERAAASAMIAPLVSGILVPTLTALVVLTTSPWSGQRIDEPGERRPVGENDERIASPAEQVELAQAWVRRAEGEPADPELLGDVDRKRIIALWAPLERPQSRGGAASLQAGQTVVLPEDAVVPEGADEATPGLRRNHVYPMLMRASPRGTKVPLRKGENRILLPISEEAEVVREVVFRERDLERAEHVAYDRRYPVRNDRITLDDGREALQLRPLPGVDLDELAKHYDGPYVVFGDYHFQGKVVQMFQSAFGVHDALVEAEQKPPDAMSLRTTVPSPSWRGPYFDEGGARPPLAMLAKPEFQAPIGARLRVAYRSPARGIELGEILPNGQIKTPPWRFLGATTHAILRHKSGDPSKDYPVPVKVELIDGTWRFSSADPDAVDFAKHERFKEYTRPYLAVPAYEFEVEVHGGVRFPASTAALQRLGLQRHSISGPYDERRSLVAVNPLTEPQGSSGELYDPHPAEVAPFMDGPYVLGGIERLGWGASMTTPRGGDLLLAIAVLLLALTTMIAWAGYGARAADHALGRGAGVGFRVVFLLVGLAGAAVELLPVIRVADYAMIGLVLIQGTALVVGLLRERPSGEA